MLYYNLSTPGSQDEGAHVVLEPALLVDFALALKRWNYHSGLCFSWTLTIWQPTLNT